MTRYRILFIIALAALAMATCHAAPPSAAAIMAKMSRSVLSSPATEAKFTINGGSGPVQGSAIMHGAAFTFATPQLNLWYDGRTQWAYLRANNEVTVTEPDTDELAMVNPFAILRNYDSYYALRRLPDNNGRHCVQLTPKSKNTGIKNINVIADSTGKWPQAITVSFDDNRAVELFIDHIAPLNEAQPATTFRYDAGKFPAAEIVDLR